MKMIKDYAAEMRKIEDSFLLLKSDRDQKIKNLEELQKKKDLFVEKIEICAKAIEFSEQVATDERKSIKQKVEDLITSCLREVFDDSYSIEFDYSIKRSRTSVEVFAVKDCEDGLRVKRQIDGIGGGVADAISLPLKLIVLLNDQTLDRILVTDEPGRNLSIDHVPKFAKFLQTISKKLKTQIIMVTHHACMGEFADSINEIHLEGSKSCVERIR